MADWQDEYHRGLQDGTGTGIGGVLADEERRQREREREWRELRELRPADKGSRSGGNSKSFEDFIEGSIVLALWAGISYYGIIVRELVWYWPVGIGFVAAFAAARLLTGPLHFMLTGIKWLFYSGIIVGLLYLYFAR